MSAVLSGYARYRQVVTQLMSGAEQLPSLPALTLEIRKALRSPDISLEVLSKLISRDPALAALLIKYCSSPLNRTRRGPKTLKDVMQVLGVGQVDRITMVHSIQSLFTLHSATHKKLFMEAWERLILQACICGFLAAKVSHVQPEQALLASLMSELGSLALLSAFKDDEVPSRELYLALCNEYSKSLGIILLRKWAVDEELVDIVRNSGAWETRSVGYHMELIDLVNLARYHRLKGFDHAADLPPLQSLSGFGKLLPPYNQLDINGGLQLITVHREEIDALADMLR
ncbi:HDOD domain-containing protein [Pseudomonas sp. GV071]|jgi:HD-like signal output (HDOD) protein|uniref:HDOD domain-containing protein n=1 Tax=Pseudomonas sp. GV071 TaxID=2135754 RepID=UPI000D398AE5|nr:HDOD domain-containing protein [Pseudomonas sp. GV071]PTQ72838.1 HD-like signal output (HDOD) protein [Pseudomonas sp. GV071]